MIVRIHKTGSSFKGCAAYLLHDKDAATSERVGWVDTHNIGTHNPQTAWRCMAATAMNQRDLKAAAGLRATGNKAKGTVLHYSLSWEEGAENLSKEDMIRAARTSLSVVGVDPATSKAKKKPPRRQFGDEHQALFVCHTDEDHQHVHVMVNRVHPEHGAILPSSNDRLKLSDWALDYERSRGEVICKQRETNQALRQHAYVKGPSNIPRHTWEMRQLSLGEAANDNDTPTLATLKTEQNAKNVSLAKEKSELLESQTLARKALLQRHEVRVKTVREDTAQQIRESKKVLVAEYGPRLSAMKAQYVEKRQQLADAHQGNASKATQVWESMKLLAKMHGEKADDLKMGDVFAPFAGYGKQLQLIKKAEKHEEQTLKKEHQQKIAEVNKTAKAAQKAALVRTRERYAQDRADLGNEQKADLAVMKAKWRERNDEERQAFVDYKAKAEQRQQLKDDYLAAAMNDYEDLIQRDHGHDDGYDDGQGQ